MEGEMEGIREEPAKQGIMRKANRLEEEEGSNTVRGVCQEEKRGLAEQDVNIRLSHQALPWTRSCSG